VKIKGAAKTPVKVHTDPWKKYGALKRVASKAGASAIKPPVAKSPTVAPGSLGAGSGTPPAPPPANTLEMDAQAAIAGATRANPPKQWDQPGGPSAPVAPVGEALGNPPTPVDRANRKFSPKELAQIKVDARGALAKGAPRDKVGQRLRDNGLDPEGVLNG
jgi:hypothetical protein